MNPLRRSELRDGLRADADRWTALAERHGTPLLVLRPHLAARRYRVLAERLSGFRLHYAVKALPSHRPHDNRVVWRRIRCRHQCGGRPAALARPADGPLHSHQSDQEADIDHAYAAGIRASSRTLARQRNSQVGPRHRAAGPVGVPQSDGEIGPVVEVRRPPGRRRIARQTRRRRRRQFAGFSYIGSQGSSAEPYGAALRSTLELIAHIEESLGVRARVIDIGGGFPVDYRESMPTIDSIADVIDDALGPARGGVLILAEPGRYLVADCMTLLTSVVGSAERDGQGGTTSTTGSTVSNVMTEDVPPILALHELKGTTLATSPSRWPGRRVTALT